jgi:hypothetical protein
VTRIQISNSSVSSQVQTADLTTLREGVICLALATNTLKFGLPTISVPKIVAKNLYHVHKAIAVYILERFKKNSMSSDLSNDSMLILNYLTIILLFLVQCKKEGDPAV